MKFNFVEKGGQPGKGDPDIECLWFLMICVCSSIFIWKPLISLLFLIRRAMISTEKTNKKANKGHFDVFRTSFWKFLISSYCFIILKLLKDVCGLNVLLCRRQQNNFRYRKYNYWTGQKKNQTDFQHTSGWSPSTLYMFGLFSKLSPSSANFPKHIWIVLIV